MRIGNGSAMPIHLNAPTSAKDEGVQTERAEKTEEAADSQDESIHISMEGQKKTARRIGRS
ncbi:hypothetical protein [Pseudoalteromonas phenolica]|uniref:hypothetical protein n=1 Tax=Pseudoalteromonas phenolica TaxID=161398 RepID=UPI000FFED8E8|nr:hypothetical protein [Pseudoalteromonas phenolica]